jgi:hypothetical protein
MNPQAKKIQGSYGLANPEQAKFSRTLTNNKKLEQIQKMSDKELVDQLKAKGLESFGTKNERVDRLKKYYGRSFLKKASSRRLIARRRAMSGLAVSKKSRK